MSYTEGRYYEPEIKSRHYWWREQLHPELLEGFIKRYHELPVTELWLVDVEDGKEKLDIIYDLCQRMIDKAGVPLKLYKTLDRREALKDANFVTTQLRVGQLKARELDERIPLSHGYLGQETNGAGGLFKGLRTIPVILTSLKMLKNYVRMRGSLTLLIRRGW